MISPIKLGVSHLHQSNLHQSMTVSAQASPHIESATEVAIAGEDIAAPQHARGEWEGTACCSLKRDWENWKWMQDTSVSAFWKAIVARSCFQFSSVQQILSVLQENEWNINSFKVQTCLRKACKSIPSSKATEDCIGHCSGKMKNPGTLSQAVHPNSTHW